jgi:uncharacterized membrane protein YbhN (UPF0104 family)
MDEHRRTGGSMRGRRHRFLLQAAASAVFITVVYWLVDVAALWGAIRRLPIGLWLFTVVVHSMLHVVQAAKWWSFLGMSGVRVPIGAVVQAHAAGQFGGVILPSVLGGDALRTLLVVRSAGKLEATLFAGIADRIVDTACMMTLVAIGFVLARSALESRGIEVRSVLLAALVLGVMAAWLVVRSVLRPRLLYRLPRRSALGILRARRAFQTMRRHSPQALVASVVGLAIQAGFVVTVIPIGEALGLTLDVRLWFALWPIAKMAAMLPASLGGLGLLELTFSFLVHGFAERELAVATAVVMQTIRLAVAVVGGAYWLVSGFGFLTTSRARGVGLKQ